MLLLVRHAHADWTDDEQRPLSAGGRAAAMRVADVLAASPVTAVCSSPSARAIQTVQPLADRLGLHVRVEPDLRERHLADGRVDDFETRVAASWREFDVAAPGAESNAAAQSRVTRAIHAIASRAAAGGAVVIATHGNALALFLRTIDPDIGFEFWSRLSMPDVYAVDLSGRGPSAYRRLWTDTG